MTVFHEFQAGRISQYLVLAVSLVLIYEADSIVPALS